MPFNYTIETTIVPPPANQFSVSQVGNIVKVVAAFTSAKKQIFDLTVTNIVGYMKGSYTFKACICPDLA